MFLIDLCLLHLFVCVLSSCIEGFEGLRVLYLGLRFGLILKPSEPYPVLCFVAIWRLNRFVSEEFLFLVEATDGDINSYYKNIHN